MPSPSQNPLLLVATLTLILSPFILSIVSNQNKETKKNLQLTFVFILFAQILLGFLNWENFSVGRSGFELSLAHPSSLLGLFFIIALFQVILLTIDKSFNTVVASLNFINSIFIFVGMIRMSSILGHQAVSFASIGAVFLVLFGNIIALAYTNKDKNLLKKYFK